MAILDLTARLYQSNSYRNTPISKAVLDSFKMNLLFRFSLIGMAAYLTGSKKLVSIAKQKYLLPEAEKEDIEQNYKFKESVSKSISVLGRQVAILQSLSEKNTAMINVMLNDLGYFKGQRKINYVNSSNPIPSVRIPIRSKTIKGKIEEINKQLQELKNLDLVEQTSQQRKIKAAEAKERRKREASLLKSIVAASMVATVGTIGLRAVGTDKIMSAVGGAVTGGVAGLLTYVETQKIIQQAVKKAIPVVGKAFSVGLVYKGVTSIMPRRRRRAETGVGVRTGDDKDYTNEFDPTNQPNEWNLRNQEISIRKSWDKILDVAVEPLDDAAFIILSFLGAKYGLRAVLAASKTLGGGGRRRGRGRGIDSLFPSVQSSAARVSAPTAAVAAAGGAFAGLGLRGAAPAMASRAGRRFREVSARVLPVSIYRSIYKFSTSWDKHIKSKLMSIARISFPYAAAYVAWHISKITDANAAVQTGQISYDEYKETVTKSLQSIVQQIGITGASTLIGGLTGSLLGPKFAILGTAAGLLTGVGITVFGDTEDASMKIAEKLFSWFGGAPPPADTMSDTTTPISVTADLRANYAARSVAPTAVRSVIDKDLTFMGEVQRVSDEFDIDPADLLSVMYKESTLDPKAVNPVTGATGLIQFMPTTAIGLGTTTAALKQMTAAEQMIYVEKYFKDVRLPRGANRAEIYGYVFMPGRMRGGTGILAVEGENYYTQNKGLDRNKDGVITVDDLAVVAGGVGSPSYSIIDDIFDAGKQHLSKAIKIIEQLPFDKAVEESVEMIRAMDDALAARIDAQTAMIATARNNSRVNAVMKETISNREYLKQQIGRPIPIDETVPA